MGLVSYPPGLVGDGVEVAFRGAPLNGDEVHDSALSVIVDT